MAVNIKHNYYKNSWGSVLVQIAIKENHRLGGLNQHLFLTVLKARTSKFRVLADPGVGGGSLLNLQRTISSYSYRVENKLSYFFL